jgi:hypothetical protein
MHTQRRAESDPDLTRQKQRRRRKRRKEKLSIIKRTMAILWFWYDRSGRKNQVTDENQATDA